MPLRVSISNGHSSRWNMDQVFKSSNLLESVNRKNSAPSRQTLFVGSAKKALLSTSQLGSKTARAKTSYTGAKSASTSGSKSSVQYYSAGQSWCGFSRQQKAILEHPSNQGKTSVRYVDCSNNGPNTKHPVCNITPRPSGFPYLARCENNSCSVLKPGRRSIEDLNNQVAADQQK